MNKVLALIGLVFSLASCAIIGPQIDGDKVILDEKTNVYTFKDTGAPVTGTVAFYMINPVNGKRYKKSIRELKNGKRTKKGHNYFPNGLLSVEFPFDADGQISGTVKEYYESGAVIGTSEYKDGKRNGKQKQFTVKGVQIKEIIYENDVAVREYDFTDAGERIVPAIERIELVASESGFFRYNDPASETAVYQPTLIMKWTNKSLLPIKETIALEGVFIDNSKDKDMDTASAYVHRSSDAPFKPNVSRLAVLRSNAGFGSSSEIQKAAISCQILINGQLYKTVKIKNAPLTGKLTPADSTPPAQPK